VLDEIGKAAREEGVAARGLKKWSAGNAESNLIPLCDPSQLAQVSQGTHPEGCPGPFAMRSVAVIQKRQATSGRRVSACALLPHCGYLAR